MDFSSILQKAKDLVSGGQEGVSSAEIRKAMQAKEDLVEKINSTTIPSSYVYYYYMLLEKLEFLKNYKSDEDTEKDIARELSDYKINKINNQEAFIDRYAEEYGYETLRERRFEFDSFHSKALAYLDRKIEQYDKEQAEKAVSDYNAGADEREKLLERIREDDKARQEAINRALAAAREAEEERNRELERIRREAKEREEARLREIEKIREEARIHEEERIKELEAAKAARLAMEAEEQRRAEEARKAEAAAKEEAARLEAARAEAARLEALMAEAAKIEAAKIEAAKSEAEKGGAEQAAETEQTEKAAVSEEKTETASAKSRESEEADRRLRDYRLSYQYPSPDLLKSYPRSDDTASLKSMADKIRNLYASFGTEVEVATVNDGPSMVRFDLKLGNGVSVYNVLDRKDDIQMALSAKNVDARIIPGTNYIGIFVSKENRDTIGLRELLDADRRSYSNPEALVPVGMDVARNCVYCDLREAPHMLIAGTTGSGKTALINSVIMSFVYRTKPSKLKMILIDLKGLEMKQYYGLPHLMFPVATKIQQAIEAVEWAVSESEDRLKKFEDSRVKDIDAYNQLMDRNETPEEKLPRIAVIIDELAELITQAPLTAEELLVKLAGLGRASGVHLIAAVQKPAADIVTPAIRNNMPAKVAMKVASRWDSKTILDQFGAENLLGEGDMLYSVRGMSDILHLQGAYVTDQEITSVVNFLNY